MGKRLRFAALGWSMIALQSVAVCQTTVSNIYYLYLGIDFKSYLSRLGGGSVSISGFSSVDSIAFAVDGTLYGTGTEAGSLYLLLLNTSTGAATPTVRITGVLPGTRCSLAFRSDGTLFASCGANLYTIDRSTGIATLRPMPAGTVGALAFARNDLLYSASGSTLYTLNPDAGGVSSATPLTTSGIVSLTFDPATGNFFAVENFYSLGLYSFIDTVDTKGNVTRIDGGRGRFPFSPLYGSIASPLPTPTLGVPTLSDWGLLILGASLAFAAARSLKENCRELPSRQ